MDYRISLQYLLRGRLLDGPSRYLPAEGEPFSVRKSQAGLAVGTKIETALSQVAFELLKPDRGQFLFAMGALRRHAFILLETNHRKPPL
jgi:hypothetical protein